MKRLKLIITLVSLSSLVACSMPERPTQPSGKARPVNSLATAEMLAHQSGYVLVGQKRDEPIIKEHFLYKGNLLKAKPIALQRQLSRNQTRDEYAQVPGAQLIERTVIVPFGFNSAEFQPSPYQRFQLRQLLAVADRVEVRGRTDGRGDPKGDETIALRRAEAAKRYLLDRNVPSNIISVNYQAAGDYIVDNERSSGRGMNRRVELEFYIDDFTTTRTREIALNEHSVPMDTNMDQWGNVDDTRTTPSTNDDAVAGPESTESSDAELDQWQDIVSTTTNHNK